MSEFQRLGAGRYLLLTTFRKDGDAVPTPVWTCPDPSSTVDALLVWTAADSGKVKRIRRNGATLAGPCDFRGRPTGRAVPGYAELLDAAMSEAVRDLLAAKYGVQGRVWVWCSRMWDHLRGGPSRGVGIRVTPGSPR